jgi:hypothetical protein
MGDRLARWAGLVPARPRRCLKANIAPAKRGRCLCPLSVPAVCANIILVARALFILAAFLLQIILAAFLLQMIIAGSIAIAISCAIQHIANDDAQRPRRALGGAPFERRRARMGPHGAAGQPPARLDLGTLPSDSEAPPSPPARLLREDTFHCSGGLERRAGARAHLLEVHGVQRVSCQRRAADGHAAQVRLARPAPGPPGPSSAPSPPTDAARPRAGRNRSFGAQSVSIIEHRGQGDAEQEIFEQSVTLWDKCDVIVHFALEHDVEGTMEVCRDILDLPQLPFGRETVGGAGLGSSAAWAQGR